MWQRPAVASCSGCDWPHSRLVAPAAAGGRRGDGMQPVEEQYFLDLEREAFVSLAGEKKSQARMGHMLKTGKPLRN